VNTPESIYAGYGVVSVLFGLWCASLWKDRGGQWLTGFLIGFVFGILGLVYVLLATRGRPSMRPPS
jgi:hypothetical protein